MRVALVTAAACRHLDDDLDAAAAALAGLGAEPVVVDWHDGAVDWGTFDLAVVRSPWDYTDHHRAFVEWVHQAGAATSLHNPPEVLHWNIDKRYLDDLARLGVAVVPTTFLAPGDPVELPGGPFVVKPTVSAGARDTARYDGTVAAQRAAAAAHVARLHHRGRTAMVQPYVTSVDARGESALVHLDGRLSHTLRKGPILAGAPAMVEGVYAREDMSARAATPAERALASAALAATGRHLGLDRPLLYARVDVVDGDDGLPLVLELELTEPSLFLALAPGSAARFATAVVGRATRG